MSTRERVNRILDELPEADLRTVERMLRGLKLPEAQEAPPVSAEERRARARAAYGFLKGSSRTLDDFLREKHEDTEREEAVAKAGVCRVELSADGSRS